MNIRIVSILVFGIAASAAICGGTDWASAQTTRPAEKTVSLWDLAKREAPTHRFSTLVTAQTIRSHLSSERGIDEAIDWCKKTGVTKVYIATFGSGYQADRQTLLHIKQRLRAAGLEVSGGMVTTGFGTKRTEWGGCCYTDMAAQDQLQKAFEFTAGLFDEIIIDDFWFIECDCAACDAARRAKSVKIGDRTYPVSGDSWEDYRGELMVRLSQDRVLAAAKRINPKVQIIIKYPQWYDDFHKRGYQVARESAAFDRIWVGTEIRDYTTRENTIVGGTPPYEAYFIMRWLGGIGGNKCGGGWYDPFWTTERAYVEQARQTVLGGARESMICNYGAMLRDTGPRNIEALRPKIPELLKVAEEVRKRQAVGVAAYKPVNSHAEPEWRVFDFVGMLGLPLAPCHEFPTDAKAAFFSVHALKDSDFADKLTTFIRSGRPVLVTDGLAKKLEGKVDLSAANVRVLPVKSDPPSLLELPQSELDALRAAFLPALGHKFLAPNRVALYLFADGSSVIENFNDQPVTVDLDGKSHTIPARDWLLQWKR